MDVLQNIEFGIVEVYRAGPGGDTDTESVVPIDELVGCLRQIQKSVRRWPERGGRQGYLTFVSQYVG
ncbi:MAG: hypothetical protein P4L56_13370 [Candidatus Sulfopaludibacter sp.]|nr:hypothetical protein [Candidatus Sulfopaludibacter sp.]